MKIKSEKDIIALTFKLRELIMKNPVYVTWADPPKWEYPDTPEPELGDHPSGMGDCCE